MSIEAQLISALATDDPRSAVDALGAGGPRSDQTRVALVRGALEAVREEQAARERALIAGLAAAGVEAAPFRTESASPLLPDVGIRVAAGDRGRAVEILAVNGYGRLGPDCAGAWASYQRTIPGVAFTRLDESPGRVELRWSDGDGRPVHRLLHPDERDWGAIRLPAALWPLYHVVHFARLPIRVLPRGRRPPDLGPFLGTPRELIGPLLDFAGLGPDDLLVDLGCGDGRILVEAATTIGCRCRGIESDPDIAAAARLRVAEAGVDGQVEIIVGDASTAEVEDADVVVLFLPVEAVRTLVPRLRAGLRPSSRIVSHELHQQVELVPDSERILTKGYAITVARRWGPR